VFGVLADNLSPWLLAVSTLFFTSFATFVFWGVLGHTFSGIMAFGLVYGSLAGGFPSLWTGFTGEFASEYSATAESKK
jgi:MCP family monocarboxylic acid transporter-like MFS transporter 10